MVVDSAGALPWRDAWEAATYAPGGFYAGRMHDIRSHFLTSCEVGGAVVDKIIDSLVTLDKVLGHPATLDFIDVGAADGRLLTDVTRALRTLELSNEREGALARRLRPIGIDIRPRPSGLPDDINWIQGRAPNAIPPRSRGLVTAFEVLDDVPLNVAQRNAVSGWCYILANPDGIESQGQPVTCEDAVWIEQHSNGRERIEIGQPRDAFALACCNRVEVGQIIFVDYPVAGMPSLAGHLDGLAVPPRPGIDLNVTAAVDFTSLTAALAGDVAVASLELTTQAELLTDHVRHDITEGESRGPAPDVLRTLQDASDHSLLTDPLGLGSHQWLSVDIIAADHSNVTRSDATSD